MGNLVEQYQRVVLVSAGLLVASGFFVGGGLVSAFLGVGVTVFATGFVAGSFFTSGLGVVVVLLSAGLFSAGLFSTGLFGAGSSLAVRSSVQVFPFFLS